MAGRTDDIRRLDRLFKELNNQETARSNAAEASAQLRERRREREEVDAYLRALHCPIATDTR